MKGRDAETLVRIDQTKMNSIIGGGTEGERGERKLCK